MLTLIVVVGLIALAIFTLACGKRHERETGLPAPSRDILDAIRQAAGDRGISEQQAYSAWVALEQRRQGPGFKQQ